MNETTNNKGNEVTDTKPTRKQLLINMERVGAAMAASMFNLAQRAGHTLTSDDISLFDEMRHAWDRACGNWQQATALTGEPDPAHATPAAVFEGYIGGQPVIAWRGEPLPAGAEFYAAPVQAQPVASAVKTWQQRLGLPVDYRPFANAWQAMAHEIADYRALAATQPTEQQPLAMVSPAELRDIESGVMAVPIRCNNWREDQTIPLYLATTAATQPAAPAEPMQDRAEKCAILGSETQCRDLLLEIAAAQPAAPAAQPMKYSVVYRSGDEMVPVQVLGGYADGSSTVITIAAPVPAQGEREALPELPGCLADRLFEAISMARDNAENDGSNGRIRKWEATAADLRATLAAKVQPVPEDYVLVPTFPTPEMIEAAVATKPLALGGGTICPHKARASQIYRAMLAASPAKPANQAVEWVSVDERLPEDHTDVIIAYWPYNNKGNAQAISSAHHINGAFYDMDGNNMHPPSHWIKLSVPAAPQQADSAGG